MYALEKRVRQVQEDGIFGVVSIAYFAENDEVKQVILRSDKIREETLRRCCAIEGYEAIPRSDKNCIYDTIRRAVEREVDECV